MPDQRFVLDTFCSSCPIARAAQSLADDLQIHLDGWEEAVQTHRLSHDELRKLMGFPGDYQITHFSPTEPTNG